MIETAVKGSKATLSFRGLEKRLEEVSRGRPGSEEVSGAGIWGKGNPIQADCYCECRCLVVRPCSACSGRQRGQGLYEVTEE